MLIFYYGFSRGGGFSHFNGGPPGLCSIYLFLEQTISLKRSTDGYHSTLRGETSRDRERIGGLRLGPEQMTNDKKSMRRELSLKTREKSWLERLEVLYPNEHCNSIVDS